MFRPYDSALKSVVPETGDATGACDAPSDVVRTYAYRCTSGAHVYDPCFVRPVSVGHQVDCDVNPWVTSAVELTLTSVVPAEPAPTPGGAPWAIELANGQRCTLSAGANTTRSGVVLNYYCPTGFAGLAVSQYHAASATASYAATSTAALTSVAVKVRWTAQASAH